MADKYEVCGWNGHWFIVKNGERVKNKEGKQYWFLKKKLATIRMSILKRGVK